MKTQPLGILWCVALLFAASGATCHNSRLVEPLPPAAFAGPPNLPEVIYAVHANTHRVQQLRTEAASISFPGSLPLRAELVMEQPRNIRLRAQFMGLSGPELDLGSNNEEFWLWVKRTSPPAVYFARHAEFAQSNAKNIMPIEPEWLFDALGLVNFDPGGIHTGPYASGQGRLEIHSRIPTSQGELTKVTVIHETYGWVLEQQVRDSTGRTLASSHASKHRFISQDAVSLPHQIDVQFPPAQLTFRLEVGSYIINQSAGADSDIWTRPYVEGYPAINLTESHFGPATPGQPMGPPVRSANVEGSPHASYRLPVRGLTVGR